MKITILNGNPNADNVIFDDYLKALSDLLESSDHTALIITLREIDLRYCTGCFDCFVKTPGECVIKDGSDDICREYIHSDFVLFASPLIMGFTSALLKKAHDRLLPLLHPYFEVFENQIHHIPRYDTYPLTGLLLEKGKDTDEEDVTIVSDIYSRDAINLNAALCFTKLTTDSVEELANEINRI